MDNIKNNKPYQREGFGPPLTNADVFESQDLKVTFVLFHGVFHAIEWIGSVCTSQILSAATLLCVNPDCERDHSWE